MFRGRQSAVLGLVLMLAACSAESRELSVSVDGRIGGDSNVLRSSFRKVEDAFFEISPRIAVRERARDLNYDLAYRPTFTTFAETEDVDGLDHLFTGNGSWHVTPVDTLSFNVRHADVRRLRYDGVGGGVDLAVREPTDRNRIRLTDARLSYSRQFSPDWSGFVSVDIDDFDPAPDDRGSEADSRAYTARLGGNYALDENTSAGLSASGRFRDTRVQLPASPTAGPVPSSKTLIWDLSVNLSRQLSKTMNLSIQVGPSFISTKLVPDISVRDIPGISTEYSQETSIFAAVSFEKEWQRARFDAAYVRSEFRGGFQTSATISDDLTATFVYELTRRTAIRTTAGWNQRVQIVSVGDSPDIDTIQWRAIASVTHRLTRQMSLIAQYAFVQQEIDGNVNAPGVGDTHIGFVSLRYTFDPIIF